MRAWNLAIRRRRRGDHFSFGLLRNQASPRLGVRDFLKLLGVAMFVEAGIVTGCDRG